MCPGCIASTAAIVAGAGSTGGMLALCIAKCKEFFIMTRPDLAHRAKGETKWQQAQKKVRRTGKHLSQ
jgi:hypothetical protein